MLVLGGVMVIAPSTFIGMLSLTQFSTTPIYHEVEVIGVPLRMRLFMMLQ